MSERPARSGRSVPMGVRANRALARARSIAGTVLVLVSALSLAPASPARAGAQTIVSLTFDDGRATAYAARAILAQYGMRATFFVNSPLLGSSSFYMTWQQIQDLYGDGNEIGGHTAYHVNLPAIDPTEAIRQICDDRVNLLNHGFPATDFAYPFGFYNATIESDVQACGYNSARTTDSLSGGAESIPPANPYAIRMGSGSGSLSALESAVTSAEGSGGWVPLVFHDICSGCSSVSISQSDFTSLLAWLQGQGANGVSVETVAQVIGGAVQPAVPGPAAPPPATGTNALRNPSLELDTNADAAPDCWQFDDFGQNAYTWSRTTAAHTGAYAEQVNVSSYTSGDNKLMVLEDLGACSPSVTPGHQYVLSAWYNSNVPVYFTVFARDTSYAFSYWQTGPLFPASSGWAQATWTTPTIPSNVTALSFGLTVGGNGSLTVDDLSMTDAAGGTADTMPPTVSLTAPAANVTVSGQVQLSANASDNVALDHVDFLVDGNVVGSAVDSALTYSWNSRTAANGNHSIAARAVDTSGNATTTAAVTDFVNNQSTNLLQNPSLEQASGSTPTCWLLGGYGTNTSTWTRTADAHSGTYAENVAITAWTSGDRKLVNTQDTGTCAPAAVPGHTYAVNAWYKSNAPSYFFVYYRNSAGSWVFWTQSARVAAAAAWTRASFTTPAVPAGATNLSVGMGLSGTGSLTMDDFGLFDNAPPADTTPPTSSISCNNSGSEGTCATYYNGPVQVQLSAVDNPGGSGVKGIVYTTDGSTPSLTNGTVYAGPFTTTTTVRYRAYDNAGNAEAVNTQPIILDSLPPASTIACNGAACSSSFYNSAVSVTLSATDTGGSGVESIRYTTDGTDPSLTNGNVYIGAFSVPTTSGVKYRAYDNAGNAEAVNTQLISIDTTPPTSTIACNGATCSSSAYNSPVSVTLSATDTGGSGVAEIVYTTDGSTPSQTNGTVYSAAFTVSSTATVNYRAYDNAGNAEPVNTQLVSMTAPGVTLTSPVNGATVGGSVTIAASATGMTVDHVSFLVDGSVVGTATSSPYFVSWDSTTVADGSHSVQAQAFDPSGSSTSSQTVTVTVSNTAPDTTPPVSTIACNGTTCSSAFYNAAVSVSLSATDSGGSGVAEIVYTTDGSTPSQTNGTIYGGAFSVPSTTTVKYRAYDNAGNAEAVNTQLISIDTTAPTSSIACNGTSCASSFYNAALSVTLSATDSGGSGAAEIVYTTDGSTPSQTNGTLYGEAFAVSTTTTVNYRAYDKAGNAEPVNSALLRVDTAPPASTIACNSATCSSGYYNAAVSVTLSATDNTGGSGVKEIVYTTNGTTPSLTNGTVYSGAFSVASTTTVQYRAYDNVGNAEGVNGQLISLDTTPPAVSLISPTGGLVIGTINLTATASDNVAVARVDFLVDGAVVGSSTSSPYGVSWNTTTVADGNHTVAARAVDTAGNATTSAGVTVNVANTNLLQNASLETASGSTPTCWLLGGYGTNTYTWSRTSDAHSGSFAEALTISAYTSGDRKLVNSQDAGTCAPAVTAGHTYAVSVWYKATSQPYIFAYYRTSAGSWVYWTQSAKLATASGWTQASWTTPAVPSGATNISVGMGLSGLGSLTMDDFGLYLGN